MAIQSGGSGGGRPGAAGAPTLVKAKASGPVVGAVVKGAGAGMRRANVRKGGFLDDLDVEVTGARFSQEKFHGTSNWKTKEQGEVTKNNLVLDMVSPQKSNLWPQKWSVGRWVPSYDGMTPAADRPEWDPEVGAPYLCDPKGGPFTGFTEQSKGGLLVVRLVDDCGWDDSRFDDFGAGAFVGLRGHTREIGVAPKEKGAKPYSVTIFESIENQKSGGSGGGGGGEKPVAKKLSAVPVTIVKKAAVVAEEEEEEVQDAPALDLSAQTEAEEREQLVTGVILEALRKAKGAAIPKAQLSGVINKNKAFEQMEAAERLPYVKLALSDVFLKKGAGEGLWAYDGRSVGPVAEEGEDETPDQS